MHQIHKSEGQVLCPTLSSIRFMQITSDIYLSIAHSFARCTAQCPPDLHRYGFFLLTVTTLPTKPDNSWDFPTLKLFRRTGRYLKQVFCFLLPSCRPLYTVTFCQTVCQLNWLRPQKTHHHLFILR